jgi:hypothetical protein
MSLKLENARSSRAQLPVFERLSIRTRQMMRTVLARCLGALEGIRNDDKDLRCHEAYFWMGLYNAALLEADSEQLRKKVQLALRAVEGRKRSMTPKGNPPSAQEWNLLQYAAIVLKRIAKNATYERAHARSLQTKEAA